MIRVRFFAMLRDDVGGPSVEVVLEPGRTVRDLFHRLVERYPALGRRLFDDRGGLSPHLFVFVDGRSILLGEGLDTPLAPDAEVSIFPPIAGG
jgi:molybdopterin synthase sulfur carrier subunit